jgi:hypothetical protein
MKFHAVRYLLTLALVVSSAAIAGNGNGKGPEGAFNPHPRPIIGTLTGEVAFPLNDECEGITGAWWQTTTVAVGEMDHFGLTEHYSTHCATLDGMSLVGGEASFVAANGDELWTTYTGQVLAPPPVIAILAEYVVTGGTGRFEGASGTIMAMVYVTFVGMEAPNPIELDFAGTIAY